MTTILGALTVIAALVLLTLCTSFLAAIYRQLLAVSEVLNAIRTDGRTSLNNDIHGHQTLDRIETALRHRT